MVRYQYAVGGLPDVLSGHEQFVIKPSKGSGGKGILVVVGREGDDYLKPSGKRITHLDVVRHTTNILSGLFSLGGRLDVAMIESMVQFSRVFDEYTFEGVPDIRVIIYKGFPVMAMTRLSTRASDGKANLHQGAVGVGLDIGTGRALKAVQYDRPVEIHPDTGALLSGLSVPHWEELLHLASRCYEVTDLGYLGADIVLDMKKSPLILELNARPGLAIQVANGAGLRPRIEAVDMEIRRHMRPLEPEQRVAFSLGHFSQMSQ